MRGIKPGEKLPNFDPLILPVSELAAYSSQVNLSYKPLENVTHLREPDIGYNQVFECIPSDLPDTPRDRQQITLARTYIAAKKIAQHCLDEFSSHPEPVSVVCVGHGASIFGLALGLQKGLGAGQAISGERNVSCFAEFFATATEGDGILPGFAFVPKTAMWQDGHLRTVGDAGLPVVLECDAGSNLEEAAKAANPVAIEFFER